MKNFLKHLILVTTIFLASPSTKAACVVLHSNGQATSKKADPLFAVLQQATSCPQSVQEFKIAITQSGLSNKPYMVANRGLHNPTFGSFSFFEEVTGSSLVANSLVKQGEFFFGHFTALDNGLVISDQEPSKGKLLIELIAWDTKKELFNFYELIGTGQGGQWFYRGDSKDILADNAKLHLNVGKPQFGNNLRCSACHTSGGPIMKEISAPFNDWWTQKKNLPLAPNKPSDEIAKWIQSLGDASDFSQSVKMGIHRLEKSLTYLNAKSQLSLQAQLRPLFCEVEVNLESDQLPLLDNNKATNIPSSFIVSSLLAQTAVEMKTSAYLQLLESFDMRFPETNFRDADHAWLVPVKGYSDILAIQTLINTGLVSQEFVADVLAIDLENPLFSSKRCGLLKLVPLNGLTGFTNNLKLSDKAEAKELYDNLTNPLLNREAHVKKAQEVLAKTQQELKTTQGQNFLFKKLIKTRESVFESEISKNPRGQILEPGFRVIFPVSQVKKYF